MQDQKAFKCPHVLYSMYRSVIDTYVTYLCHIYISLGLTLFQGFEYCVWMLLTFNNILATYYASRPNNSMGNICKPVNDILIFQLHLSITKTPQSLGVAPIDHQPINHWAFWPLCLLTIEPMDHWAYWP